jgi:predicted HD phosphohydrolase
MSYTSFDQITQADVNQMGQAFIRRQGEIPGVIREMLRQLADLDEGSPVNQLEHSLQTATRAVRDGATEEMVIAALCHDIGKLSSAVNHSAVSAEILKPYVSSDTYEIVLTHEIFQGRYLYPFVGMDPNTYKQYADRSWFAAACRFSERWDQRAFDPNFDTLPLSYFEPMIDKFFAVALAIESYKERLK